MSCWTGRLGVACLLDAPHGAGQAFHVVASLKLDFMGKHWSEEELARLRKNRRVPSWMKTTPWWPVQPWWPGGPSRRSIFYEGPFGKRCTDGAFR